MDQSLARAWKNWPLIANHPWELFITLTFPWEVSKERAEKTWRVFASKLAREGLSARAARKTGIPWASVVEQHRNGSYHIHALVSQVDEGQVRSLWADLVSTQALVDIKTYDSSRDSLGYMQKEGDVTLSNWFLTGR